MTENRKPLYAKIAIARKQLPNMDEDAYRDLLESEFGARSAKALKYGQLVRLVDILARLGARYTTGNKARCGGQVGSQASLTKHQARHARRKPHVRSDFYDIADDEFGKTKRYIAAMWRNELGYDMTSLDTLVSRMFGVESFAWLRDWDKLKRLAIHVQYRAAAKNEKQVGGHQAC